MGYITTMFNYNDYLTLFKSTIHTDIKRYEAIRPLKTATTAAAATATAATATTAAAAVTTTNPFPSLHSPLGRFENVLRRWLSQHSEPPIRQIIWKAAAAAYRHFFKTHFVPYVLSILLRSLSTTTGSVDTEILPIIETFTLIIEEQRTLNNPDYACLNQVPICQDLLGLAKQRAPIQALWEILEQGTVGNGGNSSRGYSV